ncbi:MAG: type II toxin-antitoxin system VapC family toxin [Acidobacteria bacterium]|nr:type II toxin-antitoxin system VapC family toxin [Acidobacteriota bacterium]
MRAYLDTNAVIRLAHGDLKQIGKAARHVIDRNYLLISPMVALELEYLFEIGRLKLPAEKIISHLDATIGVAFCPISFTEVARAAIKEAWTRDSFDRMIVAQARHAGNAPLVTADEKIKEHYKPAVW